MLPSVRGEARPPAFGPLSKFGGGRLYKLTLYETQYDVFGASFKHFG